RDGGQRLQNVRVNRTGDHPRGAICQGNRNRLLRPTEEAALTPRAVAATVAAPELTPRANVRRIVGVESSHRRVPAPGPRPVVPARLDQHKRAGRTVRDVAGHFDLPIVPEKATP